MKIKKILLIVGIPVALIVLFFIGFLPVYLWGPRW